MAADAPEMVVLTGKLPKGSSDGVSKCLGVYKKRAAVSGGRPTYVKIDDPNRFLWYHRSMWSQRWRFGNHGDLCSQTMCAEAFRHLGRGGIRHGADEHDHFWWRHESREQPNGRSVHSK